MLDLLIKNGAVVDGTGNPWIKVDIGIENGKIREMGHVLEKSKKTIDAKGRVVCPGFIDIHTHNDLTIQAYPDAQSSIMQGITTAVTGNCGFSMAPVVLEKLDLLKRSLSPFLVKDYNYGWNWRTLGEWCEKLESQGIRQNIAPLVGQGALRLAVKGFDAGKASEREMKDMKELLRQALEDGAFGMSTGLMYPPGSYADTEELIELSNVLKEYGALYASHIRNMCSEIIEAADEAMRIGEENDIPVQISHLEAVGQPNWGKPAAVLRRIEMARQRGVEVDVDDHTYRAGSTTITALLPQWTTEGGKSRMMERLKDEESRKRIKEEISENRMDGDNWLYLDGWDGIWISTCNKAEYEGKSLENILKNRGGFDDPYKGFFDLLIELDGDATMLHWSFNEKDDKEVLKSPWFSAGSDGLVTCPEGGGKPHPRAYGAFPRVLGRHVREENLLSLEDAIKKMTSKPASKLRIWNRGLIREDFWADLVVFDPDEIKERGTYVAPHQYPEGIDYVVVNGQVVVKGTEVVGGRPGKVLRRS